MVGHYLKTNQSIGSVQFEAALDIQSMASYPMLQQGWHMTLLRLGNHAHQGCSSDIATNTVRSVFLTLKQVPVLCGEGVLNIYSTKTGQFLLNIYMPIWASRSIH